MSGEEEGGDKKINSTLTLSLSLQRFVEKAHILEELVAAAADGASEGGGPPGVIDMQHKFFAFTMDSIMSIFFGREVCFEKKQKERGAADLEENSN